MASLKAAAGQVAADPFRAAAPGSQPPPPVQAKLRQTRALSLVLNGAAIGAPSQGSALERRLQHPWTADLRPGWGLGTGHCGGGQGQVLSTATRSAPLRPGALHAVAGTRSLGTAWSLKGKSPGSGGR